MIRKPTRQEMAAEWRARGKAHREQRLKEAARMLPTMRGNLESIFGRVIGPGEIPSTAPIGSREHLEGTEESRWLTRAWDFGGE